MRRKLSFGRASLTVSIAICSLGLLRQPALAQGTLSRPNAHPKYSVEVSPHLALGVANPPGGGTGSGLGPGVRLSFPVMNRGFSSRINDSVALGVGLDWVFHDSEAQFRGRCTQFQNAPNGTRVCVEIDGETGDSTYLYVPLVMQYNLWFHKRGSAFGEAGLSAYARGDSGAETDYGLSPVFQIGGRFELASGVFLTARLGYPLFTLGASFTF